MIKESEIFFYVCYTCTLNGHSIISAVFVVAVFGCIEIMQRVDSYDGRRLWKDGKTSIGRWPPRRLVCEKLLGFYRNY